MSKPTKDEQRENFRKSLEHEMMPTADEPTPQEIIAAYDRAIKDKEAAERERDSLREANARLAADLDAALKAGKDGQK